MSEQLVSRRYTTWVEAGPAGHRSMVHLLSKRFEVLSIVVVIVPVDGARAQL